MKKEVKSKRGSKPPALKKAGNKSKIILILAIVVFVLAMGVGAYFIVFNKSGVVDCGEVNMFGNEKAVNCFVENLGNCNPAKFKISFFGISLKYDVVGYEGGICKLKITTLSEIPASANCVLEKGSYKICDIHDEIVSAYKLASESDSLAEQQQALGGITDLEDLNCVGPMADKEKECNADTNSLGSLNSLG